VGLLGHNADQGAGVVGAVGAQVVPAQQDAPRLVLPEAQQQADQRRLARAGRPDDGDHLPLPDGEGHVLQGGDARPAARLRIGERQPLHDQVVPRRAGRRIGRIADGGRDAVHDLDQPAGRRQAALQMLEGGGQRGDRLKSGDGRQGQRRQVDALHAGDGGGQHAGHGQADDQHAQGGPQAVEAGDLPLAGDQIRAEGLDAPPFLRFRAAGQQVGQALHAVHQRRAERRPRLHGCPARFPPQAAGQQRHASAQGQHPGQGDRGQRRRVETQEAQQEDGHAAGHQRRGQDAHVEVLQGVHVGYDAAEQVAGTVGLQPGGGQRLQRGVEPDAQVGQQAERGAVADQPLQVAEDGAGDPEEAHADDRHLDGGDGRLQGRFADDPGGGGQQTDAAANRQEAEQRGERDLPPGRSSEGQQAADRPHPWPLSIC